MYYEHRVRLMPFLIGDNANTNWLSRLVYKQQLLFGFTCSLKTLIVADMRLLLSFTLAAVETSTCHSCRNGRILQGHRHEWVWKYWSRRFLPQVRTCNSVSQGNLSVRGWHSRDSLTDTMPINRELIASL